MYLSDNLFKKGILQYSCRISWRQWELIFFSGNVKSHNTLKFHLNHHFYAAIFDNELNISVNKTASVMSAKSLFARNVIILFLRILEIAGSAFFFIHLFNFFNSPFDFKILLSITSVQHYLKKGIMNGLEKIELEILAPLLQE